MRGKAVNLSGHDLRLCEMLLHLSVTSLRLRGEKFIETKWKISNFHEWIYVSGDGRDIEIDG